MACLKQSYCNASFFCAGFYPCYYFYFYDDNFNEANTILESHEFIQRLHIFLLHLLMHWAIPHLLASMNYIVLLGTPNWCRKAIKYVIDLDSESLHPWLTALVRLNAYICYARILWFYFTGDGTTHTTIALTSTALRNYIAQYTAFATVRLLELKDYCRCFRRRFVKYSTLDHINKNSRYYESEGRENKSDQEVVDAVSVLYLDVFEAMLERTGTRYIS